jgi:hypothetical protein
MSGRCQFLRDVAADHNRDHRDNDTGDIHHDIPDAIGLKSERRRSHALFPFVVQMSAL